MYDSTIANIRDLVGNNSIYVVVDESSDCLNRSICNILVGVLSADSIQQPYLIHSAILESTNSTTVAQTIHNALQILWLGELHYDRVLLLVSDAAPYMKKMGSSLRCLYPKLIHITCLAHGVHRVCEVVRQQYPMINRIIACGKQLFSKAPFRRQSFFSQTSLPLPPKVIITRWGTWLRAAFFYAEHWKAIINFVNNLKNDALPVKEFQEIIQENGDDVALQLLQIKAHFRILPDSIDALENRGLTLDQQFSIIDKLQCQLQTSGQPAVTALEKLQSVLNLNQGWCELQLMRDAIFGSSSGKWKEVYTLNDVCHYKYAPMTSVEVERSFNEFKSFFRSNRCKFTDENLMKHFVISYISKRLSH